MTAKMTPSITRYPPATLQQFFPLSFHRFAIPTCEEEKFFSVVGNVAVGQFLLPITSGVGKKSPQARQVPNTATVGGRPKSH
jgi:hypothetical protein